MSTNRQLLQPGECHIITDDSGWVNGRLGGADGPMLALPKYLRVDFIKRENDRDFFRIKEGVNRGREVSIRLENGRSSLSSERVNYHPAVMLTFKKSEKTLQTPVGNIDANTDATNPIANGEHPIHIPDFPHGLGRRYTQSASIATVWFFLGTAQRAVQGTNDRYLHPGAISEGCVTVTRLSKWNQLCEYLLRSRWNGGNTHVGKIKVED